jgi:hypothetical protein
LLSEVIPFSLNATSALENSISIDSELFLQDSSGMKGETILERSVGNVSGNMSSFVDTTEKLAPTISDLITNKQYSLIV